MKKLLGLLLVLSLVLGFVAVAEEESFISLSVSSVIEDGSYVFLIPAEDENWQADDLAQDDSVVKLAEAVYVDGTFRVRYEAVGEGDMTVAVRHMNGIACDISLTWDLHAEGGEVTDCTGGSYMASPAEEELSPYICGAWTDAEGDTHLTLEADPEGGWRMTIQTADAAYTANVKYDCELNSLVYADCEIANAGGEVVSTDSTGSLSLEEGEDESLLLNWYSDTDPETRIALTKEAE